VQKVYHRSKGTNEGANIMSYYFPTTIWIDNPDDDGSDDTPDLIEYKLPTHKEVCPRCRGRGTHDGPGFDNGFTMQDVDEWYGPDGDEFLRDYMNGAFDVRCEVCNGANVVDVVDEDSMSPEILKQYQEWMESYYDTEAIERQERMMGA
jgi:LSD1 subclass zinc finger protein